MSCSIRAVEEQLQGVSYTREALSEVFQKLDIKHYFGNVSAQELMDLLLS